MEIRDIVQLERGFSRCIPRAYRDLHGKPTGVRTLGLIGLAYRSAIAHTTSADASRVSKVLSGIGFLGAGVIVRGGQGDMARTNHRGLRLGHRMPRRSLRPKRMADCSSRLADRFDLAHFWRQF